MCGILIGATLLGGLADHFGRKTNVHRGNGALLSLSGLITLTPNFPLLLVFFFGIGMALGCDYPTAHMMISESIPSRSRGRMVLGAFGFQAIGALAGTVIGYLILKNIPEVGAWRWMYATAIIPGILVVAGRFLITDSCHWLVSMGRVRDAEKEMHRLLQRSPKYPKEIRIQEEEQDEKKSEKGFKSLFKKKHRRATILASVPWFLQDLGTYGIGIFTPTILAMTIGEKIAHPRNLSDVILNDILAAKGAAFIDLFLVFGILVAIFFADRLGRIRMQVWGFIGCALGLFLAALSIGMTGPVAVFLIFAGFVIFNFMTNAGPNAMTYLIAGEVFPTRLRGKGAGFAASFAKIGAVLTAFFFPFLLQSIGTKALLWILIFASLLGALFTWCYRIETMGKNLEEMETSDPEI
ncbi:MFS transporter [Oscillatoria amoena NRMC-F 0135]|nr:MFS transporter [Oscillatoria amoena NRMC-F 0135]